MRVAAAVVREWRQKGKRRRVVSHDSVMDARQPEGTAAAAVDITLTYYIRCGVVDEWLWALRSGVTAGR